MKKIIALIISFIVLSNTCFAVGENDQSNEGTDESPVNISKNGQNIEIDVDATEGTSGIRYTTLGYHVVIDTPNGKDYVFIPVNDGGQTGSEVIHSIPILSDGSGASLEEMSGIADFATLIATGNVDLHFNARIGIINNGELVEGEHYDSLDAIEGSPYGWSQVALDAFPTRFNRVLDLNPNLMNITMDTIDASNPLDSGDLGSGGSGDGSALAVTINSSHPPYASIESSDFNVTEGIPSGESCYIDIGCDQFKMDYVIGRYTGNYNATVTISADVTYRYHTRRFNGSTMSYEMDSEGNYIYDEVTQTNRLTHVVTYTEPYEFYTVEQLGVYGLSGASVENEALGLINLSPAMAYSAPAVALDVYENFDDHFSYNDHIYIGSLEVLGDTSTPVDLSAYAPANINLNVRNDGFILNGITLMDDTFTSDSIPMPVTTINVPFVESAFLSEGYVIENEMLNDIYESSSIVEYTPMISIGSGIDSSESIATNSIYVHTPVVCDGNVNHDIAADQSLEIDEDYMSVILGKATSFDLTTLANHRDIMGYGERDYAAYTISQQVRFPFDVYMNTDYREDGRYLEADTWCTLPFHMDTFQMYMPTWVDEGLYEVEFRTIAHNATDFSMTEDLANLDSSHYVATETVEVEVKGRLYGFTITDINDYPDWQSVFRVGNTAEHTDTYYYGGTMTIGGPDNIDEDFILPVVAGSHPSMTYEGPLKTGYGISFELETIGDYAGDTDCISITPEFRYMSYDGSISTPVDLYYCEGTNYYFTKIGEGKNRENTHYIQLGDPYRNVEAEVMDETASVLDISSDTFSGQDSKIGWFDWIVLSEPLRTFVGDDENLPSGVDSVDALISVQHWYGEYYLPDEVYAAPIDYDVYGEGTLDGKESFWLKDGYIVVNFNISTIKDGDFDTPILSYKDGGSSMWDIEGYVNSKEDAYGNVLWFEPGDIVIYDLNHASSEDYIDGGTH